jgi:hypothetical protein
MALRPDWNKNNRHPLNSLVIVPRNPRVSAQFTAMKRLSEHGSDDASLCPSIVHALGFNAPYVRICAMRASHLTSAACGLSARHRSPHTSADRSRVLGLACETGAGHCQLNTKNDTSVWSREDSLWFCACTNPCISPLTHAHISSRARCPVAIVNKLTMPSGRLRGCGYVLATVATPARQNDQQHEDDAHDKSKDRIASSVPPRRWLRGSIIPCFAPIRMDRTVAIHDPIGWRGVAASWGHSQQSIRNTYTRATSLSS